MKDDQSGGGKLCKISTRVTNRGVSKVDQTIVVETDVQSSCAVVCLSDKSRFSSSSQ